MFNSVKNLINWKIFFILLAACVVSSLLVIPYTLALTSSKTEITPVILILSAAQNLVLFAVAAFLGLLLSKQTSMGLLFLQAALGRKNQHTPTQSSAQGYEPTNQTKEFKSILIPSVGLGVMAGILIILLSIPLNKLIPELQIPEISISAWKAFLASFYGGIAEEVLLRLFLVSLFVWISFKIKKTKDGLPTNSGIWLSIVLSAVIFGLGHLPATSQILPLTGFVITRAIVLNGIGGIIFGWLYWKKGLESAMIAHFSADIVLHVITPIIVKMAA